MQTLLRFTLLTTLLTLVGCGESHETELMTDASTDTASDAAEDVSPDTAEDSTTDSEPDTSAGACGECGENEFCDGTACEPGTGREFCTATDGVPTRELSPVCGCDGMTYDNPGLAAIAAVRVASQGPCGACMTSDDCAPNEWCAPGAIDGCGTPGECELRPNDCTGEEGPVCGCDGSSYGSACGARQAGVRVASEGACGEPLTCEQEEMNPYRTYLDGELPCPPDRVGFQDACGIGCEPLNGCGAPFRSYAGASVEECAVIDFGCPEGHGFFSDDCGCGCTTCRVMDARGDGPCSAEIGIVFNERGCVGISGCDCVGEDCGHLFLSMEVCEATCMRE